MTPPNFLTAQYVTNSSTPSGYIAFHYCAAYKNFLPRNCGMAYLRQCFQINTTWVTSKSASISKLKADNAPAAPLLLHGVVGGGDHLPSGDPYAHFH